MMAFNRCLSYKNIIIEHPSITEYDKEINNWPKKGNIEFKNVNIKYRKDLNYVLKEISFKINSGEKIGICGRTGCGKTTLTLALIRILELNEGKILIDDIDISKIGMDKLRNSISIVTQEPFVFEGTLKENIDPNNNYNNNDIENLLNMFNEFHKNKFNLNLKISENGNNLSFGEKQIICIIRALIKKNNILILDEATSNIDLELEEKIFNLIYKYKKESTIITISHRVKNLKNYDKIFVIDEGKIIENDSPNNLLNNKGTMFSELFYK
jgi:ATP-binding cassette subfamily C (CFTR/MRP) protein 1